MSEINIRKIQEVMFDLYDVANGKISKFSKGYAKELAEKLEDVEQDLKARNEDPDEQLGKQIYSGAFMNKKVDTEK